MHVLQVTHVLSRVSKRKEMQSFSCFRICLRLALLLQAASIDRMRTSESAKRRVLIHRPANAKSFTRSFYLTILNYFDEFVHFLLKQLQTAISRLDCVL